MPWTSPHFVLTCMNLHLSIVLFSLRGVVAVKLSNYAATILIWSWKSQWFQNYINYFSYDVYEKINTSKSPCNKSNDWSEDNCKLRKVFIIFSIKLILIIYIAFLQQLVDAMVTKFNCVAPWLLKFARFGILLPFYLEDSWKRFADKICKHWELLDLCLMFFDIHSYLTLEITWLIRR